MAPTAVRAAGTSPWLPTIGEAFVSPNIEEGATFADAVKALGSERHATYHQMADDIITTLTTAAT